MHLGPSSCVTPRQEPTGCLDDIPEFGHLPLSPIAIC